MKRKCKSGSAERAEKRSIIQIETQNTAPIASFFKEAEIVNSDAEDIPPISSLADEARLSTSNEGVDMGEQYEKL